MHLHFLHVLLLLYICSRDGQNIYYEDPVL